MSEEEFRAELTALLKKFPEKAKDGFRVEATARTIGKAAAIEAASARCIRYGFDPDTGEFVCQEWA